MTQEAQDRQRKFQKNANGHVTFNITGADLEGRAEIKRLETQGYEIDGMVRYMITEQGDYLYDRRHRLLEEQTYKIVLVPVATIKHFTSQFALEYAKRCGYQQPKAGVALRMREVLTNDHMKKLGYDRIVILHEPIAGYRSIHGSLLSIDDENGIIWASGSLYQRWIKSEALAFLDPN